MGLATPDVICTVLRIAVAII